jgi:hypothetical protein
MNIYVRVGKTNENNNSQSDLSGLIPIPHLLSFGFPTATSFICQSVVDRNPPAECTSHGRSPSSVCMGVVLKFTDVRCYTCPYTMANEITSRDTTREYWTLPIRWYLVSLSSGNESFISPIRFDALRKDSKTCLFFNFDETSAMQSGHESRVLLDRICRFIVTYSDLLKIILHINMHHKIMSEFEDTCCQLNLFENYCSTICYLPNHFCSLSQRVMALLFTKFIHARI